MKNLAMVLFAMMVVGCSDAPETDVDALETDLDGLRAMEAEWQAGFDARDATAIAAVYADDGAVLPPNGTTVRGRAAIERFWVEFMSGGIGGGINDTEVYASGDLGYKVGAYVITDPGGTTIDVGKYVELWRRVDGKWQMTHDIFNSNMSLPAPPPPPEPDDEAEVFDDEEAEIVDDEEA